MPFLRRSARLAQQEPLAAQNEPLTAGSPATQSTQVPAGSPATQSTQFPAGSPATQSTQFPAAGPPGTGSMYTTTGSPATQSTQVPAGPTAEAIHSGHSAAEVIQVACDVLCLDYDLTPLADSATARFANPEDAGMGDEEYDIDHEEEAPWYNPPNISIHPPASDIETAAASSSKGRVAAHAVEVPGPMSRAQRDKLRSKLRRRARREQLLGEVKGRAIKEIAKRRLVQGKVFRLPDVDTVHAHPGHGASRDARAQFPLSRVGDGAGFTSKPIPGTGKKPPPGSKKPQNPPLSKEDALKLDFRYIKWDGKQSIPITDKNDRVFMVLVGQPQDTNWEHVNREVQEAFDEAREHFEFKPEQIDHRRGPFPAFAAGISYGGGQTHLKNLDQKPQNEEVIDTLLSNRAVQRIAGFGDASMRLFAPRLHGYYAETIEKLKQRHPSLKMNFTNSVFGSATFNLGPQVVTRDHVDNLNLPAGWCAITAIGDYDPTEGGHVILRDFRLIIEFPPGALILLPSAMLRHSNTTVRANERRYSFTQYSAGGLFRWVECGFTTQAKFLAKGNKFKMTGRERWNQGVQMFSTWQELCEGTI